MDSHRVPRCHDHLRKVFFFSERMFSSQSIGNLLLDVALWVGDVPNSFLTVRPGSLCTPRLHLSVACSSQPVRVCPVSVPNCQATTGLLYYGLPPPPHRRTAAPKGTVADAAFVFTSFPLFLSHCLLFLFPSWPVPTHRLDYLTISCRLAVQGQSRFTCVRSRLMPPPNAHTQQYMRFHSLILFFGPHNGPFL